MLEDCSLAVAGLAASEKDIRRTVKHEGITLSEREAPKSVRCGRAQVTGLKKVLEHTH